MFSICFHLCDQPTPLFQRDLGRHPTEITERSTQNFKIPEKVSLKSIKTLKSVKSAKNLSQNTTEPLSPRVSLKSIDSLRKNIAQETASVEPFRNPFQKAGNIQANIIKTSLCRQQPEAKVYFNYEPVVAAQQEREVEPQEESFHIPTIQIHSQEQVLVNPSEASSLIFGTPMLSTIQESQKQDMKSTHTTGQRLLVKGSFMKPKSVVSMMSSKSDNDSILLQRPSNLFELKTFF